MIEFLYETFEKIGYVHPIHPPLMEGKKELSLKDLKKGTNVSVEYTKQGTKLTAESISVGPMHTGQLAPSEKSAPKTEKKW